ncbi:MAG: glucokinase [Chryseobacterium sp.]|nr:MAG: glucokinase [Chryseobacterium sp.]
MKFPLYLPGREDSKNDNCKILAGDIGGTKTHIGWFVSKDGGVELLNERVYPSMEYASFSDILREFIRDNKYEAPDRICIGVSGPVINGKVITTNLPWSLDSALLQQEFRTERVDLINDLEATAYGLAGIDDEFLVSIYSGCKNMKGNVAILAPGTGLGEAGLFWDGEFLRPFATEGGHSEFSPRNNLEVEFYQFLMQIYGIVSWEHVISGPGLFNIYRFLRDIKKHEEPAWLTQRFEEDDPAAVINHTALRELHPACTLAMEMFVDFMAREAANLVLKLKATGGLLLGGGIPPKIYSFLNKDKFHSSFVMSDKMEHLLKDIPIKMILNSRTALEGAAFYGAYSR